MSKIIKVKITEVVQVLRTRIVDLEFDNIEGINSGFKASLENDPIGILPYITHGVKSQHSHEGDMTEEVIEVEFL